MGELVCARDTNGVQNYPVIKMQAESYGENRKTEMKKKSSTSNQHGHNRWREQKTYLEHSAFNYVHVCLPVFARVCKCVCVSIRPRKMLNALGFHYFFNF